MACKGICVQHRAGRPPRIEIGRGGPSGGGMMMMGESGSGPMMKHDRGWK